MSAVHHGMNRRALDHILIELGGSIRFLPRTGELQYSHPLLSNRPRTNARRKDASRHLTSFVMAAERLVSLEADPHRRPAA